MCFDSGGGSSKKTTTTTSQQPYPAAQPNLNLGLGDALNLYKQGGMGFEYYPQSTVSPTSKETEAAWKMGADRAMAGSPTLKAAEDYDTKILQGDFSALNPLMNTARDTINANKSLSGRYGSDVHDRAITEGLGTIMANAQGAAAGRAPGLAQAGYLDSNALGGIGSQIEGQAQRQINADVDRFNFTQEEPMNAIQRLLALSSGGWGGSTTAVQPGQASNFNPWATGIGAATSLLGSYLAGS